MEIHCFEFCVVQVELVAISVAFNEAIFRDPIDLISEAYRVGFEPVEDEFPSVEDEMALLLSHSVEAMSFPIAGAAAEEFPLDLQRRHAFAGVDF